MTNPATLRLGTRGSLLALAQSRPVAEALSRRAIDVDIVTLNTRGDDDRVTPLTHVDDAGFFSAELDDALLDGRVDLCVHSLKDLPREPSPGIARVALSRRADPRDVVLFRADAAERLRRGATLRIGSSSARRQVNVARFLPTALPHADAPARVEFRPLRGPVEQRLQPLDEQGDAALDGVILALAGLERLWRDAAGRAALEARLIDRRWMMLPLSECPVAVGQGVLAIECRADDAVTRDLLAPLHNEASAAAVAAEWAAIDALPERARDAAAATCRVIDGLGPVTFISRPDAEPMLHWPAPRRPAAAVAWDGGSLLRDRHDRDLSLPPGALDARAVFIAHWRALPDNLSPADATRLWVSGTASWRHLARRGIWVEGCADGFGFANWQSTLRNAVLGLPALSEWTVLTAAGSVDSWRGSGVGTVLATYARGVCRHGLQDAGLRAALAGATDFFWGSAAQYRAVAAWLPAKARHYCGPGKTAAALRALGVSCLQRVPSRAAWQAWLA